MEEVIKKKRGWPLGKKRGKRKNVSADLCTSPPNSDVNETDLATE